MTQVLMSLVVTKTHAAPWFSAMHGRRNAGGRAIGFHAPVSERPPIVDCLLASRNVLNHFRSLPRPVGFLCDSLSQRLSPRRLTRRCTPDNVPRSLAGSGNETPASRSREVAVAPRQKNPWPHRTRLADQSQNRGLTAHGSPISHKTVASRHTARRARKGDAAKAPVKAGME